MHYCKSMKTLTTLIITLISINALATLDEKCLDNAKNVQQLLKCNAGDEQEDVRQCFIDMSNKYRDMTSRELTEACY